MRKTLFQSAVHASVLALTDTWSHALIHDDVEPALVEHIQDVPIASLVGIQVAV